MTNKWKAYMASAILLASLLILLAPFRVLAKEASSSASAYRLAGTITAEVKSILNEQTAEGTRIAAVVRLYNEGSRVIRIPGYELIVKTKDGITYVLNPSTANAKALQPKEKAELSYMMTVNRDDAFSLSSLSWVNVDNTVYPKKETPVLTVSIASKEWKGENAGIAKPDANKKWGEPFTISIYSDKLAYKPVHAIQQNTPNGPAMLIVLQVENQSKAKQWIPDFSIDGVSDVKVYTGKRLEQGAISLQPGEKQYIHYAILMENHIALNNLIVHTPESFANNKTVVHYTIGRLRIQLPTVIDKQRFVNQLKAYDWNKPIPFDPLNKLMPANIDVSLVGLHMNEGEGYNAIVADFKLQNRNDHSVLIPNFQAGLMSADGSSYVGTRQNIAAQFLIPNIHYAMSYYFIVPNSEKGDRLAMELLDGDTASPFDVPIAAFRTQVQNDTAGPLLSFYPFSMNLSNWSVETVSDYSKSGNADLLWTYKLKLDLDVDREYEAVVDQSFTNMKAELVNQQGVVIGSQTLDFTGENRLTSGERTIVINSDIFENRVTVLIYETVDTPYGEAKRLVKKLQR